MRAARTSYIAALLAFAGLATAAALAPVSAGPLPDTTGMPTPWRLEPASPCVRDSVFMIVRGYVATPCDSFLGAEAVTPLHVRIRTQVHADRRCFAPPSVFYPVPVALGRFPAGPHTGIVEVETIEIRDDGSRTRLVQQFRFDFVVRADCDSIPPAPPPLPYVSHIAVGPGGLCGQGPICPGDSVKVVVKGVFPHDCFMLRRVQLIPSPLEIVPAPPPTVRLIVDDGGCLGRPCSGVPVPWAAEVRLPPMRAGDHRLPVELAQVTCSDTYPPGELHRTVVPFTVAPECPPPAPCLLPDFAHGPADLGVCDATVSKLHPAELTFLVRPTVALAGLQGGFRLNPPGLQVSRIEAVGPAAGMLLDWTPTADGARFVMVAPGGAPIPAWPPPPASSVATGGWPILRVTVASTGRSGIPDRTVLTAEDLLGSDIAGGAVIVCPPPPCASVDPRFALARAVICAERACDVNADGLQDVRDLVLMVRCVNDPAACPPDAPTRFDCDSDGAFGIADVLCCARRVLGRAPCPDCPPDTGQVRPEPGVAVGFGDPEETNRGVSLPLRIAGIARLGGALLTLEAPLDRYDVTGFTVTPPGDWLVLHEVRDGRIVLGLIGVRDPDRLDLREGSEFTLTLARRPGQPGGGEVAAVAGEFSGPDGVTLAVDLGRPATALPGVVETALGPGQPTPFSSETAFTLQLAQPADVAVGIYDLRGRSVATLHRAPLAAGPHVFRWDGRQADGSAAPNGVYFCRTTVGARTLSRKLILMRGD
jgi:hypothetical protein